MNATGHMTWDELAALVTEASGVLADLETAERKGYIDHLAPRLHAAADAIRAEARAKAAFDAASDGRGRYEVRQFTLCDGWVNTWSEAGAPQTYATRAEAEAELAEFLADIAAEIASGERDADQGYSREDFVIVEADENPPG